MNVRKSLAIPLSFIVDADGYAWAANMKRLLQETCVRVSRRQTKKLNRREYANLQKRYRNILTRGEKELPPIPPKQNGKRGRIAKSDAHNLWERFTAHETAAARVVMPAQHCGMGTETAITGGRCIGNYARALEIPIESGL